MEEDIVSAQSAQWCYCRDESGIMSNPQHTHTFITPFASKERSEGQYKVVFVFNWNCAIMEAYERCYFVGNLIEQNNRSLITALGPIVDPILYLMNLAVAQVTWNLE